MDVLLVSISARSDTSCQLDAAMGFLSRCRAFDIGVVHLAVRFIPNCDSGHVHDLQKKRPKRKRVSPF